MTEPEQDLELMSEEEAEAFGKPPEEEVVEELEEQSEKEAEPEKVEPEPELKPEEKLEEKPEGVLARDGKNVIPFSVLEEERTKRQALESEIAELKKVKPPAEPVVEPKPKPDFKIDSKALASKLYESAEGAEEVLSTLVKKIEEAYDAGKAAASEAATTVTTEVEFQKEIEKIKAENPWIDPGIDGEPSHMETYLFNLALEKMEKANIKPNDVKGMVKAAREAVAEGKIKFKVDQPPGLTEAAIVEREKKAREAAIREVLVKFNIKEPDAVTLAGLRNASSSSVTKLDDIDKLSGLDYEEAFSQLTPEERDIVLRRDIAPAKL